ncbi:hypothetical protein DFH08DRAFT_814524 [Mycena albidolilacea]|uniref:Uncharacterized protein n=1 Tax=Mycena albidolilacea TaxID=1033008 RepID=A0AAD6ZPZ3_9AGAR|nr:hypothetical protein DFH08DRAFT_814524 [Mycena albidolilacea]
MDETGHISKLVECVPDDKTTCLDGWKNRSEDPGWMDEFSLQLLSTSLTAEEGHEHPVLSWKYSMVGKALKKTRKNIPIFGVESLTLSYVPDCCKGNDQQQLTTSSWVEGGSLENKATKKGRKAEGRKRGGWTYYAEAIVSGTSLYGSRPHPGGQTPTVSKKGGKGTDPMSSGLEAHGESLEVWSGSQIRIRGLAEEADKLDRACTNIGRTGHPRVQGMGEEWWPRGPDEDRTKSHLMSWMLLMGKIRIRGSAEEADELDGACTDIERMKIRWMEWTDDRQYRWNWNQGLSEELDATRGKGREPRVSQGGGRTGWSTQTLTQMEQTDDRQTVRSRGSAEEVDKLEELAKPDEPDRVQRTREDRGRQDGIDEQWKDGQDVQHKCRQRQVLYGTEYGGGRLSPDSCTSIL